MTETHAWPALPRWTSLPGDPPSLRRWLAAQAGPAREQDGDVPEDWPQEESR